jgi:hypothetical protein
MGSPACLWRSQPGCPCSLRRMLHTISNSFAQAQEVRNTVRTHISLRCTSLSVAPTLAPLFASLRVSNSPSSNLSTIEDKGVPPRIVYQHPDNARIITVALVLDELATRRSQPRTLKQWECPPDHKLKLKALARCSAERRSTTAGRPAAAAHAPSYG